MSFYTHGQLGCTRPIICQMELGFQLQQMGFVHLQGRKAYLTCELFRYFFRDRLP